VRARIAGFKCPRVRPCGVEGQSGPRKVPVLVFLDPVLLGQVDELASRDGGDRSKVVERAVRYFLEHLDELRKPGDGGGGSQTG